MCMRDGAGMTSTRPMVSLSVLILFSSVAGLALGQTPQGLLDHIPKAWRQGYQPTLERHSELLTAAYQLDASMRAALQEELQVRLYDQWAYKQTAMLELGKLTKEIAAGQFVDGSPEWVAARRKLQEIGERQPLNEIRMAEWVEELLPLEVATHGRREYELLLVRHQRQVEARFYDKDQAGRLRGHMRRLRDERTARVTSTGRPKPRPPSARGNPKPAPRIMRGPGRKPFAKTPEQATGNLRRPSQATKRSDRRNTRARPDSRAKPRPASGRRESRTRSSAKLAKAPPLDDWDKHLDKMAERYGFDDAQRTKAQAIMRDLRRRAEQYRLSREDDFKAAGRTEDKKARAALEKQLNEPLDRMFDELKQRIDALATMPQRARAGSTGRK